MEDPSIDAPTHYEVLGVPMSASSSEIREAYLRKCRECHPDKGGTDSGMSAVSLAHRVLNDISLRSTYDERLRARSRPSLLPNCQSQAQGAETDHEIMPYYASTPAAPEAATMLTYYDVLGLTVRATGADIDAAYQRMLSMRLTSEDLANVKNAFATLSHPLSRGQYDVALRENGLYKETTIAVAADAANQPSAVVPVAQMQVQMMSSDQKWNEALARDLRAILTDIQTRLGHIRFSSFGLDSGLHSLTISSGGKHAFSGDDIKCRVPSYAKPFFDQLFQEYMALKSQAEKTTIAPTHGSIAYFVQLVQELKSGFEVFQQHKAVFELQVAEEYQLAITLKHEIETCDKWLQSIQVVATHPVRKSLSELIRAIYADQYFWQMRVPVATIRAQFETIKAQFGF
jgi:DnaJ-domain-containing protein 1